MRNIRKGKYDNVAYLGCLVMIGLCVLMVQDIQTMKRAEAQTIAQTAAIPTPKRKPPVPTIAFPEMDLLVAAIEDTNALKPLKNRKAPMPWLD